jgi:2'-hydroxyisoflavone reductase
MHLKAKTALILGGSRFIGYHLTQELIRQGFAVFHFRRGISRAPAPFSGKIGLFKGDRGDPLALAKAFQRDYSHVFDLSGRSAAHLSPILNKHRLRIGHYIFCSTSSVLRLPPICPYDERAPTVEPGLDGANESYGVCKREMERMLLDASRRESWPITIFRPQAVLGPYDGGQAAKIFQLAHGDKPIVASEKTAAARLNLLDVNDLVAAFVLAAGSHRTHGKIYSLANDEPVTLAEFCRACGNVSGRMIQVKVDANTELNWWHPYDLVADNSLAKRDLGIVFAPLESTIKNIWRQMENPPSLAEKFSRRLRSLIIGPY